MPRWLDLLTLALAVIVCAGLFLLGLWLVVMISFGGT